MKPRPHLTIILLLLTPATAQAESARQLLATAGVQGGLVVVIGCDDAELIAALHTGDAYLVHALDTDPDKVAPAREYLQAKARYGKVSVDTLDVQRLPYVDNLVNLLIVADDASPVAIREIARVLAPRGVALIRGTADVRDATLSTESSAPLDGWTKLAKPVPPEIDDWTHFLHGPDSNAVAEDTVVGPPRHMQWLAGPSWTRHHHSDKGTNPSVRAVLSAQGRLYYLVDETPSSDMSVPSSWFLTARDGFSGVLLWKKRIQATSYGRHLEQVWRGVIADQEVVYASLGTDQPLSALDGSTGEALRSYPGTEGFQEVIKDGPALLLVGKQNNILSFQADTGRALWQWDADEKEAIVRLSVAAAAGKVFVKTDQRVVCLSTSSGKILWQRALPGAEIKLKLKWPREKLLVKDGVVLVSFGGKNPQVLDKDSHEFLGSHPQVRAYGGRLAALSADDGHLLWETAYLPNLESAPGEIYVIDGVVWLGPDFAQPRDLHTGQVKMTRPVIGRLWTDGHHYRCYPGKATSRFVITAKRGIELIDLQGENHSRNNWVRATCRVGVTPCNGLLYAPPHSCGCYMEAKLFGFWALAARRAGEQPQQPSAQRLQRGPADGDDTGSGPSARRPPPANDWPTYRGDNARSGSTQSPVTKELTQAWQTDLGGKLSAVTVASGKVFVAQVDAHTVHALAASDGRQLWQFTAGGRVDSPPTVYQGLVLFGARDGHVYCLRATDGQLAWRFQAAPRQSRAVAYGQLESLWPVHGSVLVEGGIAYVAAGRSSHLDGGIVLYGLDPATGKVVSRRGITSQHVGAIDPPANAEQMASKLSQNWLDYKTFLAPDKSDSFSMRGALTDVMSADGGSIFMRHLRFDGKLAPHEAARPHLFSTSSLLDGAEHNRSYWVLGTGDFSRTPVAYPWIVRPRRGKAAGLAVPYGLLLAFDDQTVWGVHRGGSSHGKSAYSLFTTSRPDVSDKNSRLPDFAKRSSKQPETDGTWQVALAMRPRAMLRAGDLLVVGGISLESDGQSGLLQVVLCQDGKSMGTLQLAAPPVWDGLAAAGGKLYVALTDGTVHQLSP